MNDELLERAAYRNEWADAYVRLYTREPARFGRYERVRLASWESWERGERLTPDQIATRVEELTR